MLFKALNSFTEKQKDYSNSFTLRYRRLRMKHEAVFSFVDLTAMTVGTVR